jgi:hypothetical protein
MHLQCTPSNRVFFNKKILKKFLHLLQVPAVLTALDKLIATELKAFVAACKVIGGPVELQGAAVM